MAKLVTIYGGSGFLGRYISQRLAREGWRVRVAVRRPNQAMQVKPYGDVGQVEPVFCNIRDDASVRSAMAGADAAVNCVGILNQHRRNSFAAVQHLGAERIARIAAAEGISQLVHISAIGADRESASEYARTKAMGEVGVLSHFPDAVILRPSVIFGSEDQFFNKFAKMTRLGPVLPVVGSATRFQPVYVDDIAQAAAIGVMGLADPGVYELGGPGVSTMRELMEQMLGVIYRRRLIMNIPFWVGSTIGWGIDMVQRATFGLITNDVLTRDQVRNLRNDCVVSPDAKTFLALGITPVASDAVLGDYLWPYRPSGQYASIKDSAKNLRA
jgi:NADH dehydrogenase